MSDQFTKITQKGARDLVECLQNQCFVFNNYSDSDQYAGLDAKSAPQGEQMSIRMKRLPDVALCLYQSLQAEDRCKLLAQECDSQCEKELDKIQLCV